MSLLETVRFALRGIAANKLRSGLTVLGILIGVAAVILLVAVGTGSARSIQAAIESLGTNTLTVLGGAGGGQSGPATRNTSLNIDMVRGARRPRSGTRRVDRLAGGLAPRRRSSTRAPTTR